MKVLLTMDRGWVIIFKLSLFKILPLTPPMKEGVVQETLKPVEAKIPSQGQQFLEQAPSKKNLPTCVSQREQ